ncbi:hypothetical protein OAI96_00365 [Pelagibacteraceae bacterium]|nr:hypothetical protein [Pelagibacteraceae bacterium]
MDLVEQFRNESLSFLFSNIKFKTNFTLWKKQILKKIGNTKLETDKLMNLGDDLSTIFKTTSQSGRSQTTLSNAGYYWESLICWYLNLCLVGSNSVVIRNVKELCPEVINDCMSVRYGTTTTNTESDLIGITFPKKNFNSLTKFNIKDVNTIIKKNLDRIEISNIQCKTNWNDNAQIPMLWDIVYSSKGFKSKYIKIGKNNYTLDDLKKFTYSFVTLPSQKELKKFKTNSMPVLRVNNLSGGNYWGNNSVNGVALSIKEIFTNNFSYGVKNRTIRNDIEKEASDYNYFLKRFKLITN